MLWRAAKRRAVRLGVPFNIEVQDIEIPHTCPVMGIPIEHNWGDHRNSDYSPSLDRLIPSLGYTKGNVLVVSRRCNRIKSDATVAELRAIADFYERNAAKQLMSNKDHESD